MTLGHAIAVALTILTLFSIVPLPILLLEFHSPADEVLASHCGSTRVGWLYARLYSPFFLYPFFGALAVALLARPLREALHLLLKQSTIALCLTTVLFISAIIAATIAEFVGATPAVWDFSPPIVKNQPIDTLLKELCPQECDIPLLKKLCLQKGDTSLSGKDVSTKIKCQQNAFVNILKTKPRQNGQGHSITYWFYTIGFVAQTILFCLTFATLWVLLLFLPRTEDKEDDVGLLLRLMYVFLITSLWGFMRMVFMKEKLILYGEDPLIELNVLIIGLFGLSILHLAIRIIPQLGRSYEMGLALLGVLVATTGPIVGFLKADTFVGMFGVGSSLTTYVTTWILISYAFAPYVSWSISKGTDLNP